jgi:lipopolysaccharide export system permease protein
LDISLSDLTIYVVQELLTSDTINNMSVFDRYLFKNLLLATVFVTITLAAIILLTQSLRFLELVMDSGASSTMFWFLTFLALPRFFEVILPIALMAAVVFVYNKMTIDSELVVMRTVGFSPMVLARPAFVMAGISTVFLFLMTTWLAPLSLANMQHMRQVVKAQYSSLLFREGVFNSVAPGLTVFVRQRTPSGELKGMMIHDSRDKKLSPVTITAKRGVLVITEEGQQVVVFDGLRQNINEKTKTLNRLNFDRYTIDLPDGTGPVRQRWKEPDERTFFELLSPDEKSIRDQESIRDFIVEAHRRIVSPLLAFSFTVLALVCLLLGPVDRKGHSIRIVFVILGVIIMQGLYLAAFNLSRQSDLGLIGMYIIVLAPLFVGLFLLSSYSEGLRRRVLFGKRVKT